MLATVTEARARARLRAAGLNTAITRTPLATTHILSILCGQSNVTVPCLAAALTALFLTHPFPFILSQRDREDVHLKVRAGCIVNGTCDDMARPAQC